MPRVHVPRRRRRDPEAARPVMKTGLIVIVVSFLLVGITGDWSARIMTEQQPMKMAAAEALYETTDSAPFSLLTIGTLDGSRSVFQIDIPSVLSFLATGDFKGTVEGVNDIQAEYEKTYGPGDYSPNIPLLVIPINDWIRRTRILICAPGSFSNETWPHTAWQMVLTGHDLPPIHTASC